MREKYIHFHSEGRGREKKYLQMLRIPAMMRMLKR